MKSTMKIAGYYFCGTCGCLKSEGETSDCFNCFQKEKHRIQEEMNQEME